MAESQLPPLGAPEPLVIPEDPPAISLGGYKQLLSTRVSAFLKDMTANLPKMLLAGAIGAGVGYLTNVYVMAYRKDGYQVPPGGIASGQGNLVRGTSFWFVASMVISAIITHFVMVGPERFSSDVREFPGRIRKLITGDGEAALAHALFGFGGATLITWVLGPSLSGAVAVGLVLSMATLVRPVVTGGLMVAWRWILGKVAPQNPAKTRMESVAVSTLGAAGAMALAVVVHSNGLRFIFGFAAIVGALVLTGRINVKTSAFLIFVAAVAAVEFFDIAPVLADDGGWRECGSSLRNWLTCTGSERVLWLSAFGGGASGVGAAIGSSLPKDRGYPSDKPWSELTDDERDAFIDDYVQRFIATRNPPPTAEQIARFRSGLEARDPSWFDNQLSFLKDFGDSYWDDLSSGKQAEGMAEFFVEGWNGFKGAASSTWNEVTQLDDTLREFPGVFWDDLSSGAQAERLKSMTDSVKYAGEFYASEENRRALVDKYGPEAVDAAFRKLHEIDQAMTNADPTAIRAKIGELTGMAEFEILLGGMGDKGSSEALKAIKELKASGKMSDYLEAMGAGKASRWVDEMGWGKKTKIEVETHVRPKTPDPEGPPYDPEHAPPGGRDNWLEVDPKSRPPMTVDEIEKRFQNLKPGDRLPLTPEEAAAWGAYEKDMLLRMQNNSRTLGTGDDKMWTELKRGNPDAMRLREGGYVDDNGVRQQYSTKTNNISDKSLEKGEYFFIPEDRDFVPGEVVSYTPTRIPEVGEVLPDGTIADEALVSRIADRAKMAKERAEGIGKPTVGRGAVIDEDGRQVMGQAWMGEDGRWYQRQQVPDSSGLHPSDPGYKETWGPESRVCGDSDTFAIGGGGEVFEYDDPGAILGYKADGSPIRAWDMTEAERRTYAATGKTIPGEGNTPVRFKPGVEGYSEYKMRTTMDNVGREGVLLVDQNGIYVTRPGTYYNMVAK